MTDNLGCLIMILLLVIWLSGLGGKLIDLGKIWTNQQIEKLSIEKEKE
jgi:hypothetical protein